MVGTDMQVTPHDKQTWSCNSSLGFKTEDSTHRTRRRYQSNDEGELIPKEHNIDECLGAQICDNEHLAKANGLRWLRKAWSCISSLAVMAIRGLLKRCLSRVNVLGALTFLCFTIISALICSDVRRNAILAPVTNKDFEETNEAAFEDAPPLENRFELEYVPRDKLAEQISQHRSTIEHLKEEVRLIHERCKNSEIFLMRQVHMGFLALETNHNLELKREIEQSQESTKKLIQRELETYDADKMGMTDYALDALGGRIVRTVDTEQYVSHHLDLGVFKIPLDSGKHSPWNILQQRAEIDNCWAFVGATGKVVIELATLVRIRGVTMEHISPRVTLFGTIDSAPKDFTILGMNGSEVKGTEDLEPLGTFRYDSEGKQRQTFWGKASQTPYRFVMLWIRSNHGNAELTCVHRFRVHGVPVQIDG